MFPNRGPYGESCPFPEPSFTCLSNSTIKVLLIKRYFTLLSKALGKERPPMFPKTGPLWKQTPVSRTLLSIPFGVPSKGALSPGSPHRGPTETDAPFPEPYLAYPSGSPVKEPYLQVPLIEVPQRQTLRFQNPSSFIFQSPGIRAPFQVS